jgi:AcrR family transcriptional regulator
MRSKFECQKNNILDTAFKIWAKTRFAKTSLSPVAGELKLSKAALYRYFTNKDHLQEAMSTKFLGDMQEALDGFMRKHGGRSIQILIKSYYEFLFDYFYAHPHYFAFLLSYLMRTTREQGKRFESLTENVRQMFSAALKVAGHGDDPEQLGLSIRFIHMNCLFWFMQLFMSEQEEMQPHKLDFSRPMPEEKHAQFLKKSITYGLHGFVTAEQGLRVDFTAIETLGRIKEGELPEQDRIFGAIEEVISECGYVNASVEKIASRIGINKSSLYFYFKNKNDMLLKTIKREQEYFSNLLRPRLSGLSTFSQKLYAFIVTLISYTAHNPGLITVLNWARYQNIGMSLPRQELHKIFAKFDFLRRALEQGVLRGGPEDFNTIFIFIFFFIMHRLRELPARFAAEKGSAAFTGFTRQAFSLFCGGITAQLSLKKKGAAHADRH